MNSYKRIRQILMAVLEPGDFSHSELSNFSQLGIK